MTAPTRRTILTGGAAATASVAVPATARSAAPGRRDEDAVTWSALPDLPANTADWSPQVPVGASYWRQIGLAGPIAATHDDWLIVGGGANFPEPARTATRQPTLGKVYWNEAFVLDLGRGGGSWDPRPLRLPDAVAYAACLSTSRGALVIGGEGRRGGADGTSTTPAELFADVFWLRYRPGGHELVREDLPPLPRPASYAVAGIVAGVVHVAQGADFWALDLDRPDRGWTTLPGCPGAPRTVAVGGTRNGEFYLLSGRSRSPEGTWTFHRDAYAFDPRRARWRRIADLPWCVTAGLAFDDGGRLLVLGGDRDLDRWNEIERQNALRDAEPPGSPEWQRHNDAVSFIYDHHTGFNQEVLAYDARRDRWSTAGRFPGPAQVTTPAATWGRDLVVASGEVRPGVRTPRVWRGRTQRP